MGSKVFGIRLARLNQVEKDRAGTKPAGIVETEEALKVKTGRALVGFFVNHGKPFESWCIFFRATIYTLISFPKKTCNYTDQDIQQP